MALKDILVHVDHGRNCDERIKVALKLAELHGAHLTALYVVTRPQIPQYIQMQLSEDIVSAQKGAAAKACAQAKEVFEKIAKTSTVSSEWRQVEGDMVENVILHTRYMDLCVLSQRDPEDPAPGAEELPDQILLQAGRPVLVVPYAGRFETIGQNIMVAWDGSRLATRSIGDAMDIMEKAKKVNVMCVNPHKSTNGHHDVPGADICAHLARHGIKAEAQHIQSNDVSPGDMLLSRAADESADMIVMGAYGHRRWREIVLGGVTRHMLQHMTVPVLMSH